MRKPKKRPSARRPKAPRTSYLGGRRVFDVSFDGSFSKDSLVHRVLASDEEDAAERMCSKWEVNLSSVLVRDNKGVVRRVHGERSDGDWCSTGVDDPPNVVDELIGKLEEGPPITGGPRYDREKRFAVKDAPLDLQCSFCGKTRNDVTKIIAGPTVYICNECVMLCHEILVEDGDIDPAQAPLEPTEAEKAEKAKAESEEKAREARARLAAKASDIQAAIADGKTVTAQAKLREIAKELGADDLTLAEARTLLEFCTTANGLHLSPAAYAERMKNQLALFERVRPPDKSAWDDSLFAALGMGALGAAAYSMFAKDRRRK